MAFRLPERIMAVWPLLPAAHGAWTVYLLQCENGSLYCGIAKNPQQRWQAHRIGKGARYTRMHSPRQMRLLCCDLTATAAARCEYRVKQLKPADKQHLWRLLPVFQAA